MSQHGSIKRVLLKEQPIGVGCIWLGRALSATFKSKALWLRDFCAKLFSRKHLGPLQERQNSGERCPEVWKVHCDEPVAH